VKRFIPVFSEVLFEVFFYYSILMFAFLMISP